ncbi:hypothetical protein GWK47_033096 [Chionoecetes opilio]|uniref:Uncharacterized protein n=1 Tax=Chionoecetes opilio TaxID=41210 RepID=A0A8J5D3I2_CHIOP|nr:hypothetical protein GWK47_033096 [Chionoecetes opilio]
MAVSKSTVHRARIGGREQAAEKIVELRNQEIPESWSCIETETPPVLSGDTEDRIAVLLTGKMTPSSFLGPGKLGFDWQKRGCSGLEGGGRIGVRDKIIAFCFDTTASKHWHGARETVETSEDLVEFFATNDTASKLKDDALAFLKEALMSKNHPREDYEELLRLSYLFLGGEGPAKPFRCPGALHQARWMAKAIYYLKLQMLKSQLSLTGREKAGVERVALFIALVYCKQWHEAPISVKAPLNDVLFLEILKTYPDQTVAKQQNKPATPPVVRFRGKPGLAFFDSRIDVEEKKQMVKALDKPTSRRNSSDWREKR